VSREWRIKEKRLCSARPYDKEDARSKVNDVGTKVPARARETPFLERKSDGLLGAPFFGKGFRRFGGLWPFRRTMAMSCLDGAR
jgi:hypothetical protein